ncbi:MAG: rRNA maturation RNase YbeY, partial [Defluviitaleaceae bacterium]|nr:rRNA maturation RNase YbeY [Defluviitaleaceae bacterium]
KCSLAYENFPHNAEISILIVNDLEIQKINKEHRKKDMPTDVLSFPLFDFASGEYPPKNEAYLLGDIVISIDTAKRQAEEYEHSLEREFGFLTAHSMLHLMGYDHETLEEEQEMFKKQKEILAKLELRRNNS